MTDEGTCITPFIISHLSFLIFFLYMISQEVISAFTGFFAVPQPEKSAHKTKRDKEDIGRATNRLYQVENKFHKISDSVPDGVHKFLNLQAKIIHF